MVIDDEADLLTITTKMLETSGYKVHAFSSPVEALDHVKNGCKDCAIVVSDIRMSEMSGFELVRYIKELRHEMKIILMTAFKINKEEAQIVLPSTPIDAFVKKPFRSTELVDAIHSCAVNS